MSNVTYEDTVGLPYILQTLKTYLNGEIVGNNTFCMPRMHVNFYSSFSEFINNNQIQTTQNEIIIRYTGYNVDFKFKDHYVRLEIEGNKICFKFVKKEPIDFVLEKLSRYGQSKT